MYEDQRPSIRYHAFTVPRTAAVLMLPLLQRREVGARVSVNRDRAGTPLGDSRKVLHVETLKWGRARRYVGYVNALFEIELSYRPSFSLS